MSRVSPILLKESIRNRSAPDTHSRFPRPVVSQCPSTQPVCRRGPGVTPPPTLLTRKPFLRCVTKKNLINSCKCFSFMTGMFAPEHFTYLCRRTALYLNDILVSVQKVTVGSLLHPSQASFILARPLRLGTCLLFDCHLRISVVQRKAQVNVLQSFLRGKKAGVTV